MVCEQLLERPICNKFHLGIWLQKTFRDALVMATLCLHTEPLQSSPSFCCCLCCCYCKKHSGVPVGWKFNVSIQSLCKVHPLYQWIPMLLESWRVSFFLSFDTIPQANLIKSNIKYNHPFRHWIPLLLESRRVSLNKISKTHTKNY